YLYNFWRDADHPRGLWRRTSLESFLAGMPGAADVPSGDGADGVGTRERAATVWETVIDVDALAAAEGENWVWKGAQARYPDYDRALVHLSRGGADASVIREFDLATLEFVEDDPFQLPEAKS